MKRFWVILGALAMVCALNTAASASRIVQEGLEWHFANSAVAGGETRTTLNALGVGETDTTALFSVEGWAIPNATFSDSVVIGWILMYPDTSVAASISATSFTINIDTGGPAATWLNLGTTGAVTFTDFTTTDKVVKIPIYNNFALARGVAGAVGNWGPKMRMRIVPIGGTFPAARLSLVHFAD